MKKRIIFTVWMALALVLTIARPVSADTIVTPPANSHLFTREIKFVNLDKFPNLVLLGNYAWAVDNGKGRPPGPVYYETYQIQNKMNITEDATHPVGQLNIFWSYAIDQMGTINYKLDYNNSVTGDFNLWGGYVPNSNPLVKQTIEYSVAGYFDGRLQIYQSRQISEFNDGNPPKIETFDNPYAGQQLMPIPPVTPVSVEALAITSPTTTTPSVPVLAELQSGTAGIDAPHPMNPLPPPSLSYEQKFLLGLLLTLAVEIPAAVLLVRFVFKRRDISISKTVLVGVIASGLTLPYLWFVLPSFISNSTLYLIFGELSVFLVETLIYIWLLKLKSWQALTTSLIANTASMLIGFVLL